MDYDEVIVNEDYHDEVTEEFVNGVINKPGPLTPRELDLILRYFGMTLGDLLDRIKRIKQIRMPDNKDDDEHEHEYLVNEEDDGSYITITVPLLCNTPPPAVPTSPRKTRRKRRSKRTTRPRSKTKKGPAFATIKKIVNKKKFTNTDLKKLAQHYSVPKKEGITAIWFAAAKKGHLYIMKQLQKNGHVKDVNITNRKGLTAEEIAEDHNRGHVSKWLTGTSTKHVPIGDKSDYKFSQAFSDTDESSD